MPDTPRPGDQPLPKPNEHPDIQSAVIADIEERRRLGISRYGTALQPHNGRDMLRDAYEEAMDLTIYLKGCLVERSLEALAKFGLSGPQQQFNGGGEEPVTDDPRTHCCGLPRDEDGRCIHRPGHPVVSLCGAWGGCVLPLGHNRGKADIPENHRLAHACKICGDPTDHEGVPHTDAEAYWVRKNKRLGGR